MIAHGQLKTCTHNCRITIQKLHLDRETNFQLRFATAVIGLRALSTGAVRTRWPAVARAVNTTSHHAASVSKLTAHGCAAVVAAALQACRRSGAIAAHSGSSASVDASVSKDEIGKLLASPTVEVAGVVLQRRCVDARGQRLPDRLGCVCAVRCEQ